MVEKTELLPVTPFTLLAAVAPAPPPPTVTV
jgi:hypothetical protein